MTVSSLSACRVSVPLLNLMLVGWVYRCEQLNVIRMDLGSPGTTLLNTRYDSSCSPGMLGTTLVFWSVLISRFTSLAPIGALVPRWKHIVLTLIYRWLNSDSSTWIPVGCWEHEPRQDHEDPQPASHAHWQHASGISLHFQCFMLLALR